MKILIVAATWMEVKLLTDDLVYLGEKSGMHKEYLLDGKQVDILITGFGTTFTTFHLTRALLEHKYNMVLSIGIAGGLTPDLKIGEVVYVVSDEFADLGVESKKEFLTLFESGFIKEDEFPFEGGALKAVNCEKFLDMKKVCGITTNKSHFINASIEALNKKFNAQVETMEGAAVFYVCKWLGIPCCQIRAISNLIESEDPLHWNIPLALENLSASILNTLYDLCVPVS